MTVRTIAELLGAEVTGNDSVEILAIAPIDLAESTDLTYAIDDKRLAKLSESNAGAAVIPKQSNPPETSIPLIRVENVDEAIAKILEQLTEDENVPPAGIDPSAIVADSAVVAEDSAIGPYVVIGPRSTIGPRCVLHTRVSIGADVAVDECTVLDVGAVIKDHCQIGKRVRIGCNSVIGRDGFGYYMAGGQHKFMPHAGNAIIEDDVCIGSCSCVDRAKFGSTRVGAGTKIDNQVQVAHSVQIGKSCLICGQSGLAGSCKLGDYGILAGHAGIRDNISLGNNVQIAAFAAVSADVPDGQIVAGVPARPAKEAYRMLKAAIKLPELLKRVKHLETKLDKLGSSKDNQEPGNG